MKKIILTTVLSILCVPTLLFADASINTTEQCLVAYGGANVDTCVLKQNGSSIASGMAYPVSGGTGSQTVGPFSPGTYTYTLTCNGYDSTLGTTVSLTTNPGAVCGVTGTPAPTSASLSLSIASGLPSTVVTATWSANNTPTSYEYMIDNNGTAVPLGALTSTTFRGSDFGWNANGAHSIKIRGSNASGIGPWSASQSYTINIPAPTVNLFFSLKQKTKSLLRGLISTATPSRENTTTEIFVYNK